MKNIKFHHSSFKEWKKAVQDNLNYDYSTIINKNAIHQSNFKIKYSLKQLISISHLVVFWFLPSSVLLGFLGLGLFIWGAVLHKTTNLISCSNNLLGWGIFLFFFSIFIIALIELLSIIFLKKQFNFLFNQLIKANENEIIIKNWNLYPLALKMCYYHDRWKQWRIDYYDSPLKVFNYFLCIKTMTVLFNTANKLKNQK